MPPLIANAFQVVLLSMNLYFDFVERRGREHAAAESAACLEGSRAGGEGLGKLSGEALGKSTFGALGGGTHEVRGTRGYRMSLLTVHFLIFAGTQGLWSAGGTRSLRARTTGAQEGSQGKGTRSISGVQPLVWSS